MALEFDDKANKVIVDPRDVTKVIVQEEVTHVEIGMSGPQGPTGADGKSAYDLAVDNGFEGTEAEWVASIEGVAGATGPAGPAGADGADGADGATGPQGPQGEPGADGVTPEELLAIVAYVHNQIAPASVWIVTHSLGFFPNVSAFDSADTMVEGEVIHNDSTSLTINFSAAFSGKAYLS
jgi:hypothetical protein